MTDTQTEPDVVDLLQEQHAAIRDLFAEVLMATGRDEREDSFHRLVRLMAVHETAEEELVHPLARHTLPGGKDIVADRLAEEKAAKEMLSSLERTDVDAPEFPRLLDELRLAVLTHARSEERYEFSRLRGSFGASERAALAAVVKAAEATAPTHPHPGTESATKNLLVGPLAAMTDRIRDILRSS
jgi:hemerythrin superfamily protein